MTSETFFFSHARFALVEALRMTGVGPGNEVLLPAFICRDVLASINHLGASAVFYQVDRSLSPLELVKRDSIKAVIAVNYFGFPQDLNPFVSYANETGVGIVEDNAHGWLSKDSEGRLLGTRTAVGITSFRKTIRVVDGAVLHVSDGANNFVSPRQVDTNTDSLPLAFRIRQIAARIERRSGIPLLRLLRSTTRALRKITSGSALPQSSYLSEVDLPDDSRPHQDSLDHYKSLNQEVEIRRRRHLYSLVKQKLVSAPIQPIFATLPDGVAPYGYPFFCESADLPEVERSLRKLSVEVISWPDLPSAVETGSPDFYQQVRLVNFL